jgi:peptide/nickel transport system permease protein
VSLPASDRPLDTQSPGAPFGRRRISLVPRAGNGTLAIGVIGVVLVIAIAVLAPVIAPYSPTKQNFTDALAAPSSAHLFGTDQFGRDVFSRVIFAARTDLVIGLAIVLIAFVIGSTVGALAGFSGGILDGVLMRIVDVALAFPFLVLVIAIVTIRGPGTRNLILAASLVWWVAYARLVRGESLLVRELPYMGAARMSGFSSARQISRHLGPNVVLQPVVYLSSDIIYAILLASSVSFLGLGVQPPTAEWGQMVADSQNFMTTAWWMAFFPGLAIVLTGVAFSLMGDGLAALISRTGRS